MILYWIIFVLISCIAAKISLYSNDSGGKWFYISWFFCAIPFFPLLTLWSKNLLIDSVIYDGIIMLAYLFVYFISGEGKSLTTIQLTGIGLTLTGFIMMKAR